MLTVGLDVASKSEGTAACWVEWKHGEATIRRVAEHVTDDVIRVIIGEQADKTGVDVPLGWPDAFVSALSRHHRGDAWGDHAPLVLELRATDLAVRAVTGRRPLSVSTDRIAYPTMRMARLLAGIDRTGDGPIVEVYPAGALRIWGLTATKYKRLAGAPVLTDLVTSLREVAPWLRADDEQWSRIERNDNAFDALVASLVARAKTVGLCHEVPPEHRDLAAVEGWIALPREGTLARLAERSRLHHPRVAGGG
jgi:predicted nuclease with RNAse H fold